MLLAIEAGANPYREFRKEPNQVRVQASSFVSADICGGCAHV